MALTEAFIEAKRRGWQRLGELGSLGRDAPVAHPGPRGDRRGHGARPLAVRVRREPCDPARRCASTASSRASRCACSTPEELFAPETHALATGSAPPGGCVTLGARAQGRPRDRGRPGHRAGASPSGWPRRARRSSAATSPPADATAERDPRRGRRGPRACILDISDDEDVERGDGVYLDGIGGIDVLINNAGIFPRSPVLEMEVDEWDRVMAVNLRGTFLCARAAAARMRAQGRGGRIVNVTSGAAFVPTAQQRPLRRQQGRDRGAHPGARPRAGAGDRDHGQRGGARTHRHRPAALVLLRRRPRRRSRRGSRPAGWANPRTSSRPSSSSAATRRPTSPARPCT